MSFNLRKKKVLAQLPELEDVGYNPENPLTLSWEAAVNKVMPRYRQIDPTITTIEVAMARLGKTKEEVLEDAKTVNQEVIDQELNALEDEEQAMTLVQTSKSPNIVKKGKKMAKPFNLKKAQLAVEQPPMGPMGLNDAPELMGDMMEMQQDRGERKFANGADVQRWLTSEVDQTAALQYITAHDDKTGLVDTAKELVEGFYDLLGEPMPDQREIEKVAGDIFDTLPEALKVDQGIMAQPMKFEEVHEIIKKLAEKTAETSKKKTYNLKKTAQHKTLQNTIMWGPHQTRKVDPFLRQPVSDWHIVERNKGFGLVVDDVWNIDYETIWRENIMDKYSRPYKDADGNWVGGYIQKRFEVDKNIPETSNYQLKPGQRRKPVIPEHGNLESRLQAARSAGDIEGANNVTKPFNWKEAKKKR